MAFIPSPTNVVFLGLGVIIGYLLGIRKHNQLKSDVENLNDILLEKENEIDRLEQHVERLLDAEQTTTKEESVQNSADDLTLIDGIGPKIFDLLQQHKISTFEALAQTSAQDLERILAKGGSSFQMHRPDTWPTQAKIAWKAGLDDLKEWIKIQKSFPSNN